MIAGRAGRPSGFLRLFPLRYPFPSVSLLQARRGRGGRGGAGGAAPGDWQCTQWDGEHRDQSRGEHTPGH
jgi:hypothetical protein